MGATAEKATEVMVENIEEAIEEAFEVAEIVRSNPKLLALAGVVGVAVGVGVGYFAAKKKLESFYEDVAKEEIAEAKRFYARLNKVDENGHAISPQAFFEQKHFEEAMSALSTYAGTDPDGYPEGTPYDNIMDEELLVKTEAKLKSVSVNTKPESPGGTVTVTETKTTTNAFVDDAFDYAEELKYRNAAAPFVITHDEFYAAELDYDTQSLTYYELDDTLVDEHDQPIPNINDTVGDDQLVRFGHGSNDKNVVYVRNVKLEVDYEISKSSGSYLEEVLGIMQEPPSSGSS